MGILTRKHAAAWLISGLAVMNLLTLSALWYSVLGKPFAPFSRPAENERSESVSRFLERELNLSPEQAVRLEELRRSQAAAIKSIDDEISRLKKTGMDEMLASYFDAARGDALASAIGAKEAEKGRMHFAHLRNMMALCRPDQEGRFRRILGDILRMMGPPEPRDGRPPLDRR
jgi:hypothetical protein